MSDTKQWDRVTTDQYHSSSQNPADDAIYQLIIDVINIYVPLFVSVCGIVSNLINISIFCKLGLKDSMSVELFSLSLADFLTTFLHMVVSICYLTSRFYTSSNIDAWELGYFAFGWMLNAMYLISCWITAVITIERCFCVVFPFKVKLIFTRLRSIIAILVIYVTSTGLHVSIYLHRKMAWVERSWKSRESNVTETLVRVFKTLATEETVTFEMIFDVTVSLALTDLSIVIVLVCTVWMIYELKATSQVRQTSSMKSTDTDSKQSSLSKRERKLVKVALALAITLSACGLPRIAAVTVQNVLPEANIRQLNWYIVVMWAVAYICTTVGCTIKTFVYLVLSTSYSVLFKQCFKANSRNVGNLGWSK